MSEEHPGRVSVDSDAAEQRICRFPMSRDGETGEFVVCGHPLESTGRGGRQSDYCGRTVLEDDGVRRKHDRMSAFSRRRDIERGTGPRREKVENHPVSTSKLSFEDLLTRFEMVTSSHRDQLASIVSEARAIVATAGDPDAAAYEVAKVTEATEQQAAAARAAAGEALHEAQQARRERDRALEDKALAEGVAEDALTDRDDKVAAVEELAAEARSSAEQALADAREAAAELERVRAETAERVASANQQRDTEIQRARDEVQQVRAEAAEQVRQAQVDAERRIGEITEAKDKEMAQVQRDADERVAAARTAQAVAENARDTAQNDAAEARAAAASARSELDQARADVDAKRTELENDLRALRGELAALEKVSRTERDQLTATHTAELKQIRADAADRLADMKAAFEALTKEKRGK